MIFFDKDLGSIQESRILVEYTKDAMNILSGFSQKKLDEILVNVYKALLKKHKDLALMSVEETGYGVLEDECCLIEEIIKHTYSKLVPMQSVGVLEVNETEKTKEIGIPLGVGAVLCPDISPVAVVVSTALQLIKTGNAAIFLPSEKSIKTVNETIGIIAETAEEHGFPKGAICCLETVSQAGCKATIDNDNINFIINVSVDELLDECFNSKKTVLYGSNSPSPVFVEKTANITQAVEDIVYSRSFNNGMMTASEQYMVVDKTITDLVKQELIKNGAYFMNEDEESKILSFILTGVGKMDKEYIGKSAKWLANQAGFEVPNDKKLLVSEKHYIADRNPYSEALYAPIIAYYIENDWLNACERCMKLLVQETKGHTLAIHSNDESVINEFAIKKPVARMIVNTSAFMGAIGLTTNLFPSMVLGGLTTGIGSTSENISPKNLTYRRKVGYRACENINNTKTRNINLKSYDSNSNEKLFSEIVSELQHK